MKRYAIKTLKNIKAFTLVELLIVIGLLGAIALIVIAAINPIEQANRARDTRFKADGGQLISAIDRYFTGQSEFPWMTTGISGTYTTESAFGFMTASSQDVGICETDAACTTGGTLLTANELKSEFANRDFIKNGAAGTADQKIMIGKAQGASASVYACFIPLSKSVRQKAVSESKVYTINTSGVRTATTTCDLAAADWVTSLCYICIPE